MKIIIVGNGKVGYAIARQLAVEYHDITIVDDDAAALHRADSTPGRDVRGGQRAPASACWTRRGSAARTWSSP